MPYGKISSTLRNVKLGEASLENHIVSTFLVFCPGMCQFKPEIADNSYKNTKTSSKMKQYDIIEAQK